MMKRWEELPEAGRGRLLTAGLMLLRIPYFKWNQ